MDYGLFLLLKKKKKNNIEGKKTTWTALLKQQQIITVGIEANKLNFITLTTVFSGTPYLGAEFKVYRGFGFDVTFKF